MKNIFGDEIEPEQKGSLARKFGIPPFSVLSAREGNWQDRKRAWLALGIESELGRGADAVSYQSQEKLNAIMGHNKLASGRDPARCFGQDLMKGENPNFGKAKCMPDASGGTLLIDQYCGHKISSSGTSIFDPVLCELAYRWFCPTNGSILDPFAGGSVRGIVAAKLGYSYIGIDLRPEQIAANGAQREKICPGADLKWIVGDALDTKQLIGGQLGLRGRCFTMRRFL